MHSIFWMSSYDLQIWNNTRTIFNVSVLITVKNKNSCPVYSRQFFIFFKKSYLLQIKCPFYAPLNAFLPFFCNSGILPYKAYRFKALRPDFTPAFQLWLRKMDPYYFIPIYFLQDTHFVLQNALLLGCSLIPLSRQFFTIKNWHTAKNSFIFFYIHSHFFIKKK